MTDQEFEALQSFHNMITRELQARGLPVDTPVIVHPNGWHTQDFKEYCVVCLSVNVTTKEPAHA